MPDYRRLLLWAVIRAAKDIGFGVEESGSDANVLAGGDQRLGRQDATHVIRLGWWKTVFGFFRKLTQTKYIKEESCRINTLEARTTSRNDPSYYSETFQKEETDYSEEFVPFEDRISQVHDFTL